MPKRRMHRSGSVTFVEMSSSWLSIIHPLSLVNGKRSVLLWSLMIGGWQGTIFKEWIIHAGTFFSGNVRYYFHQDTFVVELLNVDFLCILFPLWSTLRWIADTRPLSNFFFLENINFIYFIRLFKRNNYVLNKENY